MTRTLACVVGARPNFVKMGPVLAGLRQADPALVPVLVHTGQHYDEAMSDRFFQQLGLPKPDVNLEVGSGASPYAEMARLYSIAYASVATLKNIELAKGMRLSKMFPSLSCGEPIVYSGVGESAELIQQHGIGITVEPERPESLARAIAELADDPARRDRLGQTGRALIEHDYSWSTIVTRRPAELEQI